MLYIGSATNSLVREFNITTRGEHFLQYMSKALFGVRAAMAEVVG